MNPNRALILFLNEPDIYEGVNLGSFPEISRIYSAGDRVESNSGINTLVIGLKDVITDRFLDRFPDVKYVVSNTTGIDHIQTTRRVEIVHLDPKEIQEVSATAEFALALLLSLVRKIPFIDEKKVEDRRLYRGIQLKGKVIGIFGMGRLGTKMAGYAEALGMRVLPFDLESPESDKARLLKESNVISIHLPLNAQTVDFLGQKEFSRIEKKPYLINTSRPQIVNKKALLQALETGRIAGAAMDFISYDGSQAWDEELKRFHGEKLLLTPHIAGNTHESLRRTAEVVIEKLIREFRKETNR